MKITESTLRKIVRKLVKEEAKIIAESPDGNSDIAVSPDFNKHDSKQLIESGFNLVLTTTLKAPKGLSENETISTVQPPLHFDDEHGEKHIKKLNSICWDKSDERLTQLVENGFLKQLIEMQPSRQDRVFLAIEHFKYWFWQPVAASADCYWASESGRGSTKLQNSLSESSGKELKKLVRYNFSGPNTRLRFFLGDIAEEVFEKLGL
jgi:hypothetical protein